MRLNEILKENKDIKNTSSLMERKVDELADENGALSSQVCENFAVILSFQRWVNSNYTTVVQFLKSRNFQTEDFFLKL